VGDTPPTIATASVSPAAKAVYLDPTHELTVTPFEPTQRSGKITGTVGLMDISKPGGGKVFVRYLYSFLFLQKFYRELVFFVAGSLLLEDAYN
jgi:hypothetical protein